MYADSPINGQYPRNQSIFNVYRNKRLMHELTRQKGQIIFSLRLDKITRVLPRGRARRRLSETLDNMLAIYYTTM